MQLFLNDSFMIRKIIVAAVPAALLTVGMSLAISEPANACRRSCSGFLTPAGMSDFVLSSGGGGAPNTTNTNQVYPNNRRSGFFDTQGSFQLSPGGGRGNPGSY